MTQKQARLQENYDWIVLGDSPAALLSGALVARMGLSVLIVAEEAGKKWWISETGQVIDLEPNFCLGLARMERLSGVVGECLNRLRMVPSEWNRILRPEIPFVALTPHVRAQFSMDQETLEREIKREAGADPSSWLALAEILSAAELVTHGYWRYLPERLTLRDSKLPAVPLEFPQSEQALHKKIESLFERPSAKVREWLREGVDLSKPLPTEAQREWLDAWIVGALGREWPMCSPYHVTQLLSMARTGVRVVGGISALRQSMLRLAMRLGAQWVAPTREARRIFVEGEKLLGAQLGGHGSVVRARGVASGIHSATLKSWVSGGAVSACEDFEGIRVTLALSVRDAGVPEGLQARCVWKEAGAPAIEIERARCEDYELPAADYEILFVRSVFSADSAKWDVDQWRAALSRMHRQVGEIIPFLKEHEFRRFPDFEASDFAQQWKSIFEVSHRHELMRVPVRPLQKSETWSVDGLFMLDGSLRPEWGSLGEFTAALEAAAWIAHRSGLSGPLG